MPPTETFVPVLAGVLANALAQDPGLASDPEALARRIASDFERLGAAQLHAGAAVQEDHADRTVTAGGSPRDQVLAAIARHPAGRAQGLPPDALCALTGLPLTVLGETVSALVQSGDLVRDAWLVRLPQSGDLLPHANTPPADVSLQSDRPDSERRAIGDRRRLGERRLYERRH
jgi:hypothetical protein